MLDKKFLGETHINMILEMTEQEASEHLEKVGKDDWIENSVINNTHLYFNGRLTWNIKYPVRRSFFKDHKR